MFLQIVINLLIGLYGLFEILKFRKRKIFLARTILYRGNLLIFTYPFIITFFYQNFSQLLIYPILIYFFFRIGEDQRDYKNSLFKDVIISLNALAKLWPVILIISWLSFLLFKDYPEQNIVSEIRSTEFSPQLVKYLLMIVLISPIIEEFCFRKVIYRDLKKYIGIFGSAFFTSILFALMHKNLHSFAVLFALGFSLCYFYEKFGSIKYPIFIHSIFNVIMFLFIKS